MALGSGEKRRGWQLNPSQLVWKLSDRARQFRQASTLPPAMALGRRGEDLAHRYLERSGYAVVARNYKPGADSEVDIVASKNDLLIFVEVKSRTADEHGSPARAVDLEKQRHIVRAARSYTTRSGIEWSRVRFDLISIVFTNPETVTHHQDAFFHGRAF